MFGRLLFSPLYFPGWLLILDINWEFFLWLWIQELAPRLEWILCLKADLLRSPFFCPKPWWIGQSQSIYQVTQIALRPVSLALCSRTVGFRLYTVAEVWRVTTCFVWSPRRNMLRLSATYGLGGLLSWSAARPMLLKSGCGCMFLGATVWTLASVWTGSSPAREAQYWMRALPQGDWESYFATTPGVYIYELIPLFDVPAPPLFVYCSIVFVNVTEAPAAIFGPSCRGGSVDFVLRCCSLSHLYGPLKRLSLSRAINECEGQGALIGVPEVMFKERFDFGILRLIDRMYVGTTLPFVAVARLCKVDWDAHGLHDWLPYEYESEKFCCVIGSAPMVCKPVVVTERNVAGSDSVRTIYCEEFAKLGISVEFARGAWLQYSDKKLGSIGVPSVAAQDALLK